MRKSKLLKLIKQSKVQKSIGRSKASKVYRPKFSKETIGFHLIFFKFLFVVFLDIR